MSDTGQKTPMTLVSRVREQCGEGGRSQIGRQCHDFLCVSTPLRVRIEIYGRLQLLGSCADAMGKFLEALYAMRARDCTFSSMIGVQFGIGGLTVGQESDSGEMAVPTPTLS